VWLQSPKQSAGTYRRTGWGAKAEACMRYKKKCHQNWHQQIQSVPNKSTALFAKLNNCAVPSQCIWFCKTTLAIPHSFCRMSRQQDTFCTSQTQTSFLPYRHCPFKWTGSLPQDSACRAVQSSPQSIHCGVGASGTWAQNWCWR
jgi:hypothetical protein